MLECFRKLNWALLEKQSENKRTVEKDNCFYLSMQMDLLKNTDSKWVNGCFQSSTGMITDTAWNSSGNDTVQFIVNELTIL